MLLLLHVSTPICRTAKSSATSTTKKVDSSSGFSACKMLVNVTAVTCKYTHLQDSSATKKVDSSSTPK